jgi:tetratricopeptide (TPR) repeat protein
MKIVLTIVLVSLTSLCWAGGGLDSAGGDVSNGRSQQVDNKEYVIVDGSIIRYNGPGGAVIIPSTVDNTPVLGIGVRAFANKGLQSVVIPDGVLLIDAEAFEGNPLESVTIPANVRVVGDAFPYKDFLARYVEGGRAADTFLTEAYSGPYYYSQSEHDYSQDKSWVSSKQRAIVVAENRRRAQEREAEQAEQRRQEEARRAVADKKQRLEEQLANGRAAFDRQDYNGAAAAFNQALAIDPNAALAYRYLGDIDFIKGNYDASISQYSRALGITQNDSLVYYHRGLAYYNKKDYTRSVPDFDRAVKLNAKLKRPPTNERDCVRDIEGKMTLYKGMPVQKFPMDAKNMYAYDNDVVYYTSFDVNQWVGKSFLATVSALGSSLANNIFRDSVAQSLWSGGYGSMSGVVDTMFPEVRIYVRNVSDIKQIGDYVGEAYLSYVGVQNFTMADNSHQEFPVFDIVYVVPD